MELRQLEYFQMVSRLNSITKAAEQLHIAQPSVTIAIKKLEEELGVMLFDRTQKQITLTTEGRIFLQRVDEILSRIYDATVEMNDYRLLQKGSIKIGFPPSIGAFLFPHLFARFQKRHPQFDLTVVEAGSLSIRSQLERGELDLGVIITSNASPRLTTVSIVTGQILVCLPNGHPLGQFPTIPFSMLSDQRFILLTEDTYSRQIIMEECKKHRFTPHIVFSSSQIETIRGLVEQGVGISFLLDAVAEKRSKFITRPLAEPLYYQIGLAWNKERYLSKASKAFIDFIQTDSSHQQP
jgi:DNA-binding transcriptional LysR family regulator